MNLATARKFLVALAGVLAQVLAANLLHGTALHYTQVAAAAVAAVLVYVVPNDNTGGKAVVDDTGVGYLAEEPAPPLVTGVAAPEPPAEHTPEHAAP